MVRESRRSFNYFVFCQSANVKSPTCYGIGLTLGDIAFAPTPLKV